MFISKEKRKEMLNNLEYKCNNSKIFTPKTLGILIRCIHINLPIYIIIAVSLASKFYATIAAIGLFLAYFFFILFNGCFLSALEKRLCRDTFTIADPVLEIMGYDVNNDNRYICTYIVMGLNGLLFSYIYYNRFIKNTSEPLINQLDL
jgi:hypothetical protein